MSTIRRFTLMFTILALKAVKVVAFARKFRCGPCGAGLLSYISGWVHISSQAGITCNFAFVIALHMCPSIYKMFVESVTMASIHLLEFHNFR